VDIRAKKYWVLPAVWAGLIFFMSSRQGVQLPPFQYADKLAHLCVYVVLGFLIARALIRGHLLETGKAVALAFLIGALYGLSDEAHQMFVPTRSPETLDLLSDALGSCIGAVIYAYVPRISKKD